MTEYEIAKAVLNKLGYQNIDCYYTDYNLFFDPCNNAQQAWEIMLQHNICITKDGCLYSAYSNLLIGNDGYYADYENVTTHSKPFVAAMLLFLEI